MTQVTVTGATSLIGHFLLPILESLKAETRAVSRHPPSTSDGVIHWLKADIANTNIPFESDEVLIHLAPIWTLPELLENSQTLPRRVICFSSTSRFSKLDSTSEEEKALAQKLEEGEDLLVALGEKHNLAWTLFRPTLIYGGGLDENISSIARFIN